MNALYQFQLNCLPFQWSRPPLSCDRTFEMSGPTTEPARMTPARRHTMACQSRMPW